MNIRKTIIGLLACLILLCGCGGGKPLYKSENFSFSKEMAAYMVYYTRTLLGDEMKAAKVDEDKPLSEQIRSEGETWADYVLTETLDNMEKIALYCESARLDKYVVSEGMQYKSSENVVYLQKLAEQMGMTDEEYVKRAFGDDVTLEAFTTCLEMMALCEGYEMSLFESTEVTAAEVSAYADEHPEDYLIFEGLRYTTSDKALADSLADAGDPAGFLKVMSSVSGTNVTDSDKDGVPDALEVRSAVSEDDSGEFAAEDGRAVGDTEITEKDGKYTVTMISKLPARDVTRLWDFRLIYLSSESSDDPEGDANSLIEQWREKGAKEEEFASLAERYSDDPSAYYGGLYSGIEEDEMPTAAISDWITGDRKAGDATVISNGDEGTYMVYFVEGNMIRWQYDAMYDVKREQIDEKIEAVKEELAESFAADEAAIKEYID